MPAVTPYAGPAPYAAGFAPGSLGVTPMNGDFFVELTELNPAPPPAGYKLNDHVCFKQVTVSASGITQPLYPTLANATTATFGGEGLETQRARLIVGPATLCSP